MKGTTVTVYGPLTETEKIIQDENFLTVSRRNGYKIAAMALKSRKGLWPQEPQPFDFMVPEDGVEPS